MGLDPVRLNSIDSIVYDGIAKGAMPGCVVLVIKDGKVAYHKGFGQTSYNAGAIVTPNTVYDMASVTKICATTIAIMKLTEEGKIKLTDTLGTFLPWTQNSNKGNLIIKEILLHQAGLVAFIPFYKEMIDAFGAPLPYIFDNKATDSSSVVVAENLFLKDRYVDTIYQRILQSPVAKNKNYVYSDNDFIFLGKVVEALSGLCLDEYVNEIFYRPMGLNNCDFLPKEKIKSATIAPTEQEPNFRRQLLQGFVHDPGAALFGGVAGHAGLFSDALSIGAIMQMLVDGGKYNHQQYLQQSTIDLFTSYGSNISRRGLGFDKPEKNNASIKDPYPARRVPLSAFGHTGFTGTCTWADPLNKIVYVFLSNRVHPQGGDNRKLLNLNIRGKIHDVIYDAIIL